MADAMDEVAFFFITVAVSFIDPIAASIGIAGGSIWSMGRREMSVTVLAIGALALIFFQAFLHGPSGFYYGIAQALAVLSWAYVTRLVVEFVRLGRSVK